MDTQALDLLRSLKEGQDKEVIHSFWEASLKPSTKTGSSQILPKLGMSISSSISIVFISLVVNRINRKKSLGSLFLGNNS